MNNTQTMNERHNRCHLLHDSPPRKYMSTDRPLQHVHRETIEVEVAALLFNEKTIQVHHIRVALEAGRARDAREARAGRAWGARGVVYTGTVAGFCRRQLDSLV